MAIRYNTRSGRESFLQWPLVVAGTAGIIPRATGKHTGKGYKMRPRWELGAFAGGLSRFGLVSARLLEAAEKRT